MKTAGKTAPVSVIGASKGRRPTLVCNVENAKRLARNTWTSFGKCFMQLAYLVRKVPTKDAN